MPPDILSSKEYKAAILALGQRFAHRVPQALQSTWQEGDWVRWPKELIAVGLLVRSAPRQGRELQEFWVG